MTKIIGFGFVSISISSNNLNPITYQSEDYLYSEHASSLFWPNWYVIEASFRTKNPAMFLSLGGVHKVRTLTRAGW